jgi:hypothetical protein
VIAFAAAIATSSVAADGATEAASRARAMLRGAPPVLAFAFASASYDDGLDAVPDALERELGRVPVAGGTAGGAMFDQSGVETRGVLVVLLGGDGVRAMTATAPIASPELMDVVPAGARVLAAADAAAADGYEEALCLAFAPGGRVDGESLVAAVRKGTATRTQLAGALTGDDFTFDRARVFADGGARADRALLAGVFTKSSVGIAARHGWRPSGPPRVVTRTDGAWVVAIDGRRAIDAWLGDVRAADGRPPSGRTELCAFLANHWELGVHLAARSAAASSIDGPARSPGSAPSALPVRGRHPLETLLRAPVALRDDGAVLLTGGVTEGTRVRVMRASPQDMLDAASEAAEVARERVGGHASGVLLLSCAGRFAALGERFGEEPSAIARALDAPVAGACVFGEIARAHREIDAFHNATAVVIAWPR